MSRSIPVDLKQTVDGLVSSDDVELGAGDDLVLDVLCQVDEVVGIAGNADHQVAVLVGMFLCVAEVGVVDGVDLFISYTAGSGNDVSLSTVPEPATMSLLALGGLAVLRRRRR
ncbi:hypothetical protein LCGC14_0285040 [marine sediment metagenome]|uniref:Ice-binding protein C-terminal domain-containing protein n=1 Tax=marine sediment metagenome TaxID=412755 RepID=A0A0F9TUZ7_9ZZZZ|nr:PEP-CTERM sorting domain-containing protein [Phycisphaerae bacterium]HDZ45037.1 PEP-CTERM sorting domain-containing protein [Phycisphaerae bacterium]